MTTDTALNVALNVWFFGCWNEPGHFWYRPGGGSHDYSDEPEIPWIDGGFAPRKAGRRASALVRNVDVCWCTEATSDDDRRSIAYNADERDQGIFLRHVVVAPTRRSPPTTWTLIAWRDRCQGDTRGACNSTLVVEGDHDTDVMITVLAAQYPHVVANLQRNGIALVQVIS